MNAIIVNEWRLLADTGRSDKVQHVANLNLLKFRLTDRIRPKADGPRYILSWIQVEWKPTCVLPFLLIETVSFIPAMPSAIQMREDVAQLYSQFNFVKVICRVHLGDQRRQMFLCVFKFVHEPSPLDWRTLFVYHCRSVGLSSHFCGHDERPLLAETGNSVSLACCKSEPIAICAD